MSQICPNCQKENADEARFCYSCGATLGEVEFQAAEQTYAAPLEAEKPPRRLNWRCCGAGCLVVVLVLLVGLPVLHISVVRPWIQEQLLNMFTDQAEDAFEFGGCYRSECFETITEDQINDGAKDIWDQVPGAREGQISLKQDEIVIQVSIYGIALEAGADVRVDRKGEMVVKSVRLNSALSLLFEQETLGEAIADFVNDNLVRPNEINFLAFQVTDGELFIVYANR